MPTDSHGGALHSPGVRGEGTTLLPRPWPWEVEDHQPQPGRDGVADIRPQGRAQGTSEWSARLKRE